MVFYKRMMDPSFWGSTTYVQAESEAEALFWQGMISSADDQGRIKDVPQVLWATIFAPRIGVTAVTVEDVERWLVKLAEMGNILRYRVENDGFIQMLKWGTYQLLYRPRASTMPPPPGWVDTVPRKAGENPDAHFPAQAAPPKPKQQHPAPQQAGYPDYPGLPTCMPTIPGSRNNPKGAVKEKPPVIALDDAPAGPVPLPVVVPRETMPEPDVQPEPDEPEPVAVATPIAACLPKHLDPAAPAVKREPPPGATRLPQAGHRELALLGTALLNGGLLDAKPQDAVDWIMQNDELLASLLREKGHAALGEVGGRSGKAMYAVIAERYIAHKTGTRRDDE